MPSPQPESGIERIQRDRALADALVQAGLAARMAYSLVGGMVSAAQQAQATEASSLLDQAQQRAEQAKNADMALDHAIAGGPPGPDAIREAAQALESAADAYRTAADIHEIVRQATGDA